MASFQLQIDVTTSRDCASFNFVDSTAAYNAISNPTGYDPLGIANVSPSFIDQTNLKLEVTNMANPTVTSTIMIPSTAFNVTRIPGVVSYNITKTILGYTISDGIYKFLYTIVDQINNNRVYQASCYVLNDCAICCTLDQKLKDLKSCGTCNDKNNRTIDMLYEAYMLREKAHHLVSCNDITGATQVIDYLNRLLDLKTCDNCN